MKKYSQELVDKLTQLSELDDDKFKGEVARAAPDDVRKYVSAEAPLNLVGNFAARAMEITNPDLTDLEWGRILFALGKLEEAEIELRKAIERGEAGAYTYLGLLYQQQGKTAEAVACYEKSDDSMGRANLGYFRFTEGRKDEAEVLYREAVKLAKEGNSPKNELVMPYVNLGMLYRSQGKYKDALGIFEEAYKLGQKEALTLMAETYYAMNDMAKAGELMQKAAAEGCGRANFQMANICFRRGLRSEGETYYRRMQAFGYRPSAVEQKLLDAAMTGQKTFTA